MHYTSREAGERYVTFYPPSPSRIETQLGSSIVEMSWPRGRLRRDGQIGLKGPEGSPSP